MPSLSAIDHRWVRTSHGSRDSLVEFDVEIRGRDTNGIRVEVVSSGRRAQEIVYEERDGTVRIEQERRRSLWRSLPRRVLVTVPPGILTCREAGGF